MDETDVRRLAALRTRTKPFADKKQMLTALKANARGPAAANAVRLLKQSHAEACIIETTDKQMPGRFVRLKRSGFCQDGRQRTAVVGGFTAFVCPSRPH
ncbi:hypothetical protein ACI48J_06315 [Paenibacillus chitinolyticus]|uniref:hypothetical protein n=1 Tax=Paenibacillus chitinolyticus TaxID=79263 RepID=UPI00386B1F48